MEYGTVFIVFPLYRPDTLDPVLHLFSITWDGIHNVLMQTVEQSIACWPIDLLQLLGCLPIDFVLQSEIVGM